MKTVSTKKRLWRTLLVALSITAIFGSCQDEFDQLLGICPEVETTNPDDKAVGVQLDKAITVTFNDAINPATITGESFSLRVIDSSGGIEFDVPGTLTHDPITNTMSFLPDAPLAPNTTYTGKVEAVIKDMMGNALQSPYVWSFTTGASPTVTSTSPVNVSNGNALNIGINAKFSAPMNPLTINSSSFTLKAGTTAIEGQVSYTDSTATFDPSTDLIAGTTYTATISVVAANMDGIPLASDYTWTFNTGAAPTITSVDPKDLDNAVTANKLISATFSETMDPATISATSFTLKIGNVPVAGTVTYADLTAVFKPLNPLLSATTYTATISNTVKNPVGISITSDFVWKFTTETVTIPKVSSTDPVDKATNIAVNKVVNAVFSETMDPSTLTGSTFMLKQGNTVIAGTVTYSGTTASFTPNSPLSPSLVYTATITTGAKNVSGTALASNHVWSFTTAASESVAAPTVTSTDPANNATNIAFNKVVKAVFSETMDPATLTGATFTLKQGNTAVAGTVSYSGSTASFTPNSPLSPRLIYIATITTGAKNASGSSLVSNHVWNFTTAASESAAAPTVNSTDPTSNATNIALNKVVKAVFSETMNSATLTGATFTLKQGNTAVAGTVSYSGTTASFTPNSPLSPSLVYTATITNGAKNASGTALASNYVWNFTTVASEAVVPPTVTSTDPVSNATNVAVNKVVKAVFSETMDPATISGSTFMLKQGNTVIAGTVSYSGTTASFTPNSPLSPSLVYNATITNGAKNASGTALASNYVWNFTTVASEAVVPPTVTSTDPVSNATNVAVNKVVKAVFSETMDPATITAATFTLKQGNAAVAGVVTYSGTTASFAPNSPLSHNLVYTATITNGVKNASGTALANNYVWNFTTEKAEAPTVTSTDPVNNATNVAVNKVAKAVFSETMDPATITAATFTLKQGNAAVAGVVTYSGTTASFAPNSPLSHNLVYTATITNGVKNASGTALANNYVWNFTTERAEAPIVTSTDPMNNATNVAVNKVVKAVFSETMNPATITAATFTLKQGNAAVAGVITYSGTTASFAPNNPLSPNLVYTATITTNARSASGTALANDYVWTFKTLNQQSAYFVDLKSAGRFGIFAATGISNNAGFSEIQNLDVGITPGARSSITGFPPAIIVNGASYAADDASPAGVAAMLIKAKSDLTEAYLFAEGATSPAPVTVAGDQGGKTLAPGIYKSNSTLLIQGGDLTLDAQGDPNAVWIFQIASGFTTVGGAGGSVILTGGAQAKNIFWQVGSSATIGDNTKFKGNVLALTSITLNSNATVVGRMLVINGAVVLTNTNFITKP